VASRLVPAALRPAVVAIYDFARSADDIADEGDDTQEARLAQLEAYARSLDRIEDGDTPDEAPFPALAAAVRRHALPLAPMRDLLSAFRQDVLKSRYASFADLLDYCARSANPIGRLMLHLFDVTDAESTAYADAICSGLQLTNLWQDVAADWRRRRVYLPAEDLVRFEVHETQIAAGVCDARWTRLLAFEVERARELLISGWPLTRTLRLRLALELKLVIAGGLRILAAIDAAQGDVFRHRPRLRARDWLAIAPVLARR
jgi:squalene synthase HpnC